MAVLPRDRRPAWEQPEIRHCAAALLPSPESGRAAAMASGYSVPRVPNLLDGGATVFSLAGSSLTSRSLACHSSVQIHGCPSGIRLTAPGAGVRAE